MVAVSVVVAVRNAAAYLPRFVACLQAQTLGDFEAVFVDDASDDDSAAMLEAYAAEDRRLRLLRHAVRQGAGAARNAGIEAAAGETLCFADPDDLLPPDSFKVRYEAYRTHHAVVRACHDEVGGDGVLRNHEIRPPSLPLVAKPADAARSLGPGPFLCAHWTWLFPTKMVRRLGVGNEVGVRTAEDIMFLVRLFFHVTRLCWIKDTVYYWIKRTDSLSNTVYTAEHYCDYLRCVEIFYEEAVREKALPLADEFFGDYLACYLSHLLFQAAQGKSSEEDARIVVAEASRLCRRYGALARRMEGIGKHPWNNRGYFKLLGAMAEDGRPMIEKLAVAHAALAALAPA